MGLIAVLSFIGCASQAPARQGQVQVQGRGQSTAPEIRFRILEITQDQIILSTGSSAAPRSGLSDSLSEGQNAGLRPGQELKVVRQGQVLKEPSTGLVLQMPAEEIGRIQVVSQFGSGGPEAGSICKILSGSGFTLQDRVELLSEGGTDADF